MIDEPTINTRVSPNGALLTLDVTRPLMVPCARAGAPATAQSASAVRTVRVRTATLLIISLPSPRGSYCSGISASSSWESRSNDQRPTGRPARGEVRRRGSTAGVELDRFEIAREKLVHVRRVRHPVGRVHARAV